MNQQKKTAPASSDLMILVAFVAAFLALCRPLLPAVQDQWNAPVSLKPTLRFYYLSTAAFPVIAALTLAVPALRLRRPLPRLRYLSREPGVVTCIAASFTLLVLAIWFTLIWYTPTGTRSSFWPIWMCHEVRERVGYVVAGVWFSLGMLGRLRPKADWIDRLGLFVGVAWLIIPIWTILVQIPYF